MKMRLNVCTNTKIRLSKYIFKNQLIYANQNYNGTVCWFSNVSLKVYILKIQ